MGNHHDGDTSFLVVLRDTSPHRDDHMDVVVDNPVASHNLQSMDVALRVVDQDTCRQDPDEVVPCNSNVVEEHPCAADEDDHVIASNPLCLIDDIRESVNHNHA